MIEFFPPSSRSATERRRKRVELTTWHSVSEDYLSYGYEYFDNDQLDVGYGGYNYDGRYAAAATAMVGHYGLNPGDRVLEIGCAKGFVLVEFQKLGMTVFGIDASDYAVRHAYRDVRPFIILGDAAALPFPEETFDLVYGKEILPHLSGSQLDDAMRESMRVSKGQVFFEIQCGRTVHELEYLTRWDATHKTIRPPEWWDARFRKLNYSGDCHFKVLFPER